MKKILKIFIGVILVIIIYLGLILLNQSKIGSYGTKYNLPSFPISNIFSCSLNKSYYAPYSFSSASGPKIKYLCHCPTNSYNMSISSHTGMSVVLGNGGDKTIEYQCVKNYKVCPDGYKLTSYADPGDQFTCAKN